MLQVPYAKSTIYQKCQMCQIRRLKVPNAEITKCQNCHTPKLRIAKSVKCKRCQKYQIPNVKVVHT